MNSSQLSSGRLLILGCGYLGRALALRARESGLDVSAVTRNAQTVADLNSLGVRAFCGRLDESAWHDHAPVAPEYVVNCVGSADRTEAGYRQSYLEGLESIMEWAGKSGPGIYLHTGSTGVYGRAAGRVDESTRPDPNTERSRILWQVEQRIVTSSVFERWFILRLAGLYGPGRHNLLDRVLAGQSMRENEPDRPLNLIHRDDAVEAILTCLGTPPTVPSQILNLAGGEPVSRLEMVEWIEKRCRELGLTTDSTLQVSMPRKSRGREVPARIICSRRIREVTGWQPKCPDFRSGYEAIFKLLKSRHSIEGN